MKSRLTHPLTQVVLTSIVTIAVSVGCSASRSAGSPAQVTDNPTISQSSSPIVSSSAQEKATCALNLSQAPAIDGLRLGMTSAEVQGLFPGSSEDAELNSTLSRPPNKFGISSFQIRPPKYDTKGKFAGISHLTFILFDGKVSNFTVHYSGPEYSHVDRFIEKLGEDLQLPAAPQWEAQAGLDHQSKMLKCVDFEVRVFTGGQGGNLNHVVLIDLEADKQLKERRRKMREQTSPTPGNQ